MYLVQFRYSGSPTTGRANRFPQSVSEVIVKRGLRAVELEENEVHVA